MILYLHKEGVIMARFVENYVCYIEAKRYKRSYIAQKAKIEVNKLSRILNGKQPIMEDEMDILAKAVGKNSSYFKDDFRVSHVREACAYYTTGSDEKIQLFTEELRSFADAIDVILGAQNRIKMAVRGDEEWS